MFLFSFSGNHNFAPETRGRTLASPVCPSAVWDSSSTGYPAELTCHLYHRSLAQIMISRACRTLPGCKTKAAFAVVENLSATRQTCRLVFASRSNHSQKLGTPGSLESSPQQERARREGNGQREKKIVDLDEPTTTGPYALPQATWSLSDLNVATDDEEATETARAILSPQEVCNLWT